MVIGPSVVGSLRFTRVVGVVADRRTVGSLLGRRGTGAVGGALSGAIPSCGGATTVVSLYGRGAVRFGTLRAALAATAGDSAFVLFAVAPRTALGVYGVDFLVAVALGVVVNEGAAARSAQRA